jgi:hypothetical protein
MSCEPEYVAELPVNITAARSDTCLIQGAWTDDFFGIFETFEDSTRTYTASGYLVAEPGTGPSSGVIGAPRLLTPDGSANRPGVYLTLTCPVTIKAKRGKRSFDPAPNGILTQTSVTFRDFIAGTATFGARPEQLDVSAETLINSRGPDFHRLTVNFSSFTDPSKSRIWTIKWPDFLGPGIEENYTFDMRWLNPGVQITMIPGCTRDIVDINALEVPGQFFQNHQVLETQGARLVVPAEVQPVGSFGFILNESQITPLPNPPKQTGDEDAIFSPIGSPDSSAQVGLNVEAGCTVPAVMRIRTRP